MVLDFYDNESFKSLKMMPLVHIAKKDRITGKNNGELILKDGAFNTKRDDALSRLTAKEENLIFFFYAKPAYKDPIGFDPMNLPIIFIVETQNSPARIFPFDTGAFINNRFVHSLGNNYEAKYNLMDFQLIADIKKLGKYINSFWKNNISYYKDRLHIHKRIVPTENKDLVSLIKLIKAPITPFCDERKHTIELQFDKSMELNGNLKAVFISQNIITKNPSILDNIAKFTSTLLIYRENGGFKRLQDQISEFLYKEIDKFYRKCRYYR